MASGESSLKPWNAEDIRKNVSNWSLEGDSKLLEFMKTISQNLEKRAVGTKSNLNNLISSTEHTSIALDNVTNKLANLQHSQFVENRVHEDDEVNINQTISSSDIVKNEQKSYNPTDTLKTILRNSLTVLDDSFEKVSIDIEDSDEEDELAKSIIYRPKNPFDQRQLPHIIGSKEWKEKWHIGLRDSDDDDYSEDENNEQYSSTSSPIESVADDISLTASLPSNAPTISESEISSNWGLQRQILINSNKMNFTNLSDDEDISSNTITSKNSSSEDSRNRLIFPNQSQLPSLSTTTVHTPSAAILVPDKRYYIHKPKEKNLFDESSSSDNDENDVFKNNNKNINSIHHQTKKLSNTNVKVNKNNNFSRISNIINDEPPPDFDEVDKDKFDNEQQQQLFIENDKIKNKSSTENILTSINNEKIKDNKNDVQPNNNNNIRKKTVNLFDDDDFNSFMKELDKKSSEIMHKDDVNNTKVVRVKNLFDNDDEDAEVAIFNPTSYKDLINDESSSSSPLRGKDDDTTIVTSREIQSFSHHENDEKQIHKDENSKSKILNLFDDELQNNDENDDFDEIFGSSKIIRNKVENIKRNLSFNNEQSRHENLIPKLFSEELPENDDNDDDDDDIFKTKNSKLSVNKNSKSETLTEPSKVNAKISDQQNKINIFSNSLTDDELFSRQYNQNNNSNEELETNNRDDTKIFKSSSVKDNSKIDNSNIFNDGDKISTGNINDFANVPEQKTIIKNKKFSNLFSSDDEDDDIFSFNSKTTTTTESKNIKKINKEGNKNIKNDNDDDDKINEITKKTNTSKINEILTNLFSDDDGDNGDIFSTKKHISKNSSTYNTVTNLIKSENAITSKSIDNFNENIDENKIHSKTSRLMNLFNDEPPNDVNDIDDYDQFNDNNENDIFNSNKSTTITPNYQIFLPSSVNIINNTLQDNQQNSELEQQELSNEQIQSSSINSLSNNESIENTLAKTKITSSSIIAEDNDNSKNNQQSLSSWSQLHNENQGKYDFNEKNSIEKTIINNNADDDDDNVQGLQENQNNNKINENLSTLNKIEQDKISPIKNEDDHNIQKKFSTDNEKQRINILTEGEKLLDLQKLPTPSSSSSSSSSKENEKTKFNYNSISLFQDIPPEDDFQSSISSSVNNNDQKQNQQKNQQQQQQRNIFYDDILETITEKKFTKTTINPKLLLSSNYHHHQLFSDEPPPDDGDIIDQQKYNEILNNNQDIVNDSQFNYEAEKDKSIDLPQKNVIEEIKDSLFSNNNNDDDGADILIARTKTQNTNVSKISNKLHSAKIDPSPMVVIPLPKKLDSSNLLNINVKTLLPGTKRPSWSSSSSVSNSTTSVISTAIPTTTIMGSETKSYSSDKILENIDSSNYNLLPNFNKNRAKIPIKRRPSTRTARKENYRKSLLQETEESVTNVPEKIETETSGIQTVEIKGLEKTQTLINDNKNLIDGDIFNFLDASVKKVPKSIHRSEKTNVYDVTVDKSIVKTISTGSEIESVSEVTKINYDENFICKYVLNFLDTIKGSSQLPLNLDELTKINKSEFNKNEIVKEIETKIKELDLCDDIFHKDIMNYLKGTKKINDSKEFENFKYQLTKLETEFNKRRTTTNTKFLNSNKKIMNNKNQTSGLSSIFSSDDDDDDYLFGGISNLSNTRKTLQKKSQILKKTDENLIDKLNTKTKSTPLNKMKSLFGDDDDDDIDDNNLFGGGNDKGNTSSKSLVKSRNVPIVSTKELKKKNITTGKSISDNPLSDLLNE